MSTPMETLTELRIQRVMKALQANNMEAYYVKTAAEVKDFVANMIPEGAVVSNGGSVSLSQTGVLDLLAGGKYHFLDRRTVTGAELVSAEEPTEQIGFFEAPDHNTHEKLERLEDAMASIREKFGRGSIG